MQNMDMTVPYIIPVRQMPGKKMNEITKQREDQDRNLKPEKLFDDEDLI